MCSNLQDNLKDKQAIVDVSERKCQCLEDENFRLREDNERLRDELRFLRTEVRHTAAGWLSVWSSCSLLSELPGLANAEGIFGLRSVALCWDLGVTCADSVLSRGLMCCLRSD